MIDAAARLRIWAPDANIPRAVLRLGQSKWPCDPLMLIGPSTASACSSYKLDGSCWRCAARPRPVLAPASIRSEIHCRRCSTGCVLRLDLTAFDSAGLSVWIVAGLYSTAIMLHVYDISTTSADKSTCSQTPAEGRITSAIRVGLSTEFSSAGLSNQLQSFQSNWWRIVFPDTLNPLITRGSERRSRQTGRTQEHPGSSRRKYLEKDTRAAPEHFPDGEFQQECSDTGGLMW